jgi:hypothetical protein
MGPRTAKVLDGSNPLDGVDTKLTLFFEPIGRAVVRIEVDAQDTLKPAGK